MIPHLVILCLISGNTTRKQGHIPLFVKECRFNVVVERIEFIGAHHPAMRTHDRTPSTVDIFRPRHIPPQIGISFSSDSILVYRSGQLPAPVQANIPLFLISPVFVKILKIKTVYSIIVGNRNSVDIQEPYLQDSSPPISAEFMLGDFRISSGRQSIFRIQSRRAGFCKQAFGLSLLAEELQKSVCRSVLTLAQFQTLCKLAGSVLVDYGRDALPDIRPLLLVLKLLDRRPFGIFGMPPLRRGSAGMCLNHSPQHAVESQPLERRPAGGIDMYRLPPTIAAILEPVVYPASRQF